MRQSQLILSNAVIVWVARVLLLVPQLIFVPYLIETIGEEGYGVYALVWSLMISIEQLQRSLQQGVVKYSAGFLAQGRMDKVNEVVSSSFVYSLLLAGVASTSTLIAATFYKGHSGQICTVLVVVGIAVLFIFPLTPYIAVIQSRQRYYVGAIAGAASSYLSLFAVIVWFHFVGPLVEAVIVIMTGMLFLASLAQVPVAYRLVPGLTNSFRLFDWRVFRLIISFGVVVVVIGLCLMVNSTGVRWLMNMLVSTSFVAHLAIALMPASLLSGIIVAVTVTVMPATSSYEATGNKRMLQELLIRGMRYTMLISLAGLFAAGLLMRNVLSLWVGPNYVFLAPYALALFAGMSFMLSTSTSHHMLKGLGWLRITVFISLVGLVIVPIGLILIMFYVYHNPYVAVTSGLVTGNVVCGCLQLVFGAKAAHADLRGVLKRVYVQPLIIAALVFIIVFCLTTYGGIDDLVGRTCVFVLAILLFFSGCYVFIATAAERNQLKEFLQMAIGRVLKIRVMQSRKKQP